MKTKKRFLMPRYLAVFVAGSMASLFVAYAATTTIETNLSQALQYIKKIVLTDNGGQNGTTGIVLDGDNGNAYFSGNVGIGTNTPGYKFDVNGTGNVKGLCFNGNDCRSSWPVETNSQWQNSGNNIYYTGDNVGIGTNNPNYTLDVNGNPRFNNLFLGTSDFPFSLLSLSRSYSHLRLLNNGLWGNLQEFYMGANTYRSLPNYIRTTTGYASLYQQYSGDHKFFSTGFGYSGEVINWGIPKMVITRDGNVGIGVNNPNSSYKLDVNGMGNFNSGLAINSYGYLGKGLVGNEFGLIGSDDDYIAVVENGIYKYGRGVLNINNDDRVGIGKENPQYALDVNGMVNATNFSVNGSGGINYSVSFTGIDGTLKCLNFKGGILVSTGCN